MATMAAAIMIAVTLFKANAGLFSAATLFPMILAGGGLLGCLLGLGYAAVRKMGDDPSKELNLATYRKILQSRFLLPLRKPPE